MLVDANAADGISRHRCLLPLCSLRDHTWRSICHQPEPVSLLLWSVVAAAAAVAVQTAAF
jgi:hypothetical protein